MSDISRKDIIKACEETGFNHVGYPRGIEGLRVTINDLWQNHIQDPEMRGTARPVKYKYEWLVSKLRELIACAKEMGSNELLADEE